MDMNTDASAPHFYCPICAAGGLKTVLLVKEKLVQDGTGNVAYKMRCAHGHRYFLVDGRAPSPYNRHADGEWK